MKDDEFGALLMRLALCLLVAIVAAPVIHGVATEISQAAGPLWPFSAAHCRSRDTPGCAQTEQLRHATLHVR